MIDRETFKVSFDDRQGLRNVTDTATEQALACDTEAEANEQAKIRADDAKQFAQKQRPPVEPPEHDERFLPDQVDPLALIRTCLCDQAFTGSTPEEALRMLRDHVDAAS